MNDPASLPSPLRRWIVAARPWALPASVMPVLFGTALAVVVRPNTVFRPLPFLAALFAMALLHTGANMLSDVFDFRSGLDREPNPSSGAIVRGWLSAGAVARAAVLLLLAGAAIGAVLAWRVSSALWWIGGVGIGIGLAYPLLKAVALGDLAVILNFGLLGAAGAWVVQTGGRFNLYPVIYAIPMSLLVAGILHANNWRDIEGDTDTGVRTLASLLGDDGSLHYYGFLLFAPFGFLAALIWVSGGVVFDAIPLPATTAVAFLAIPKAARLWMRAVRRHRPRQPLDFIALDGATAELNLLFGALVTIGVIAAAFLERAR